MSNIFDKLTTDVLEKNLEKYLDKNSIFKHVSINKKNIIISVKDSNFHITIFRDQWNDYQKNTNLPEKLFHITHEKTQCSIYFVLNDKLEIREPSNFNYEQQDFGLNKSTRKRCDDKEINIIIKNFETLIKKIGNELGNNNESNYYQKYLKYKEKYLELKKQLQKLNENY
ncbi:MAG: hypothetical protein Edafosvirus7_1 [Edafosvirus sp.]|uniref:Uncharacterized protein n=1 Tax=Edafosvirus sp. TaxID=2487765 RepID=A0A3G4ZXR2_9VIRU|nr:MAG: hypothetical protein Edafosvirus7_1 [Edafosvirus sp.]